VSVLSNVGPVLPHLLPMLARSWPPFDAPSWRFEIKWDGVRAMACVAGNNWRLWGRDGVFYTDRYPELDVLCELPHGTMLDGELVAIRDGRADFHALMSRHRRQRRAGSFVAEPAHYVVFDLLYYRGECLMDRPMEERLYLLHTRLPRLPFVSPCDGVIGEGRLCFQAAVAAGHEGIVAKKLSSPYRPNRRDPQWRKIKQTMELPCVIIGYRDAPDGVHELLMATLMDKTPRYVGTVELGIPRQAELVKRLRAGSVPRPVIPCSLSAKWVKPQLFGTVRFCGWRPGGAWRDPVLTGWTE
jgi:ATP-dependent DNA ligase